MSDPFLSSLEQKYNLPQGILAATQHVESRGDNGAVSNKGARGAFQLMPETARTLKVDPHNYQQAADGSARLWRENLNATNGDVDQAAMMYHAGPDRKGWGPQTQAYPGKILAALQGGQANAAPPSTDPFEQSLSGAPASSDPFEQALEHGRQGNGVSHVSSGQAGEDAGSRPGDQNGNVGLLPGGREGGGNPASGPGRNPPANPDGSVWTAVPQGLGDLYTGLGEGWNNFQNSVMGLGARATDAIGLTHGSHDRIDRFLADQAPSQDANYAHPEGWARSIGKFVGEAVPTLPVTEIKGLQIGAETPALVRALKMAGQGAAAGALTSGGNDIAVKTAAGTVLAPVAGAALENVAIPAAQKMGAAIRAAAGKAAAALPESVMPKAVQAKIADMVDKGASAEDVARAFPDWADVGGNRKAINWWTDYRAKGGKAPVTFTDAPTPDPKTALADGLRAAGAKQGIEAIPALPKAAQADFEGLVAQGVPADHALNEAAIRHVGGSPTVGTVTRDRVAQEAEKEGAKLTTPEGQALAAVAEGNNAAIHQTAQKTVADYGGVPAQGEAAEAAAASLAKASDAAKAKVSEAYAAARAQDGDQGVSIDALRELLAKPGYKAPTTAEGKQLVAGLKSQISAMAKENRRRFSPDEIDQLTKAANDAFNPMGGGANHMVGEVKAALGESLDQFENAGPAYKAARDLHRQWAQQYDDPAGISRLISRDASGNFINGDNWRQAANGLIGTTSDKGFIQVVRQLRNNGDTASLNRLKADIVQRAYQRATNSAADSMGNGNFSAKAWETELNKVGMAKLKAIFSTEELAHLATIGRAARAINEAVPGTVNGSNTASKLANALRGESGTKPVTKAIGAAVRTGAHLVAGHAAPGVGNVGVEAAATVAKKVASSRAENASAKAIAQAMKESLDPALARQAANDDMAAEASRIERAAHAKSIAKRLAAPASSSRSDR